MYTINEKFLNYHLSKQNISQSYNDFQEHHEWIDEEVKTESKERSSC